jgi:hypothetical protein
MNIFYLDKDCVTSAQYHTDKHVVKMILEYSQLLCTAHRLLDDDVDDRLYRATHKNHPSAKYVRYTDSNYKFVYRMFTALCDEYTYRYGKVHLTDTKLRELLKTPPKNIPVGQMTRMPQAMPDEFKCCDSIIAYRNYYRIAKQHLHTWTKRAVPQFITT